MNQFSFNLDQNYLQHDKFGAHYSKNWDKKNRTNTMHGIIKRIKINGEG